MGSIKSNVVKMGRPKLSPERLKSNVVTVRFSDSELAAVIASRPDQPISETIRELALQSARKKRPKR